MLTRKLTSVLIGMVYDKIDEGEEFLVKPTWPEVVGLTVEVAEKIISKDMPWASFHVVLTHTHVKMEYKPGHVRLFVDSSGLVAYPPHVS